MTRGLKLRGFRAEGIHGDLDQNKRLRVIRDFKNDQIEDLEIGQEVDLMVFERTDLGHNVVINNLYKGLIFENETFRRIAWGDNLKGYVKNIREDGKIDVSLQPIGFRKYIEPAAQQILDKLKQNNGILHLSDHSDPIEIMEVLEMSKKSFKKAIGGLYKDKKIDILTDSIVILEEK